MQQRAEEMTANAAEGLGVAVLFFPRHDIVEDRAHHLERVAAERDTYALYLADHIKRVVSKAPPFTDEQVDKLVTLLRAS